MEKLEMFFIPTPLMGHAGQLVELATLLVNRFHHLTITILVMKLPGDQIGTDYTNSLTDYNRIKFIHFPPMDLDLFTDYPTVGFLADAVIQHHKPIIREVLASRVHQAPRLCALVVDMLCTPMIDVGNEFGVPTYVFFPMNAAILRLMFYFQTLDDEHGQYISKLANSSIALTIPGYDILVPTRVLPYLFLDKHSWSTRFVKYIRKYRQAKGIIVNTFRELEPRAILSYDNKTPPVYTVGPMLKPTKCTSTTNNEVLRWLKSQTKSTVVFLCFGSRGWFNKDQVREITIAIERTEYRFIWSLRKPPSKDQKGFPRDYTDYNEVLPNGFLERTAGKGRVVGWVPQTEVLADVAVGGFVSHCGWNSILESLWYGVPVATWPIDSEQQMNAYRFVKELKLAVEITLDYSQVNMNQSIVSAKHIEKGIRDVMDRNSDIRANVTKMKAKSRMALNKGGSSSANLKKLVNDFI